MTLNSRWKTVGLVLGVLLLAGVLLRPFEEEVWGQVREGQPALNFSEIEGAAGQGIVLGLLSGARALLADLIWVRGYTAWADMDVERSSALINLAVGIDPRPLFFWINGGRILAYDLPAMRVDHLRMDGPVPEVVSQRIHREQAEQALVFFERGLGYHPDNPWFLVDMANIHQKKLDDLEGAALLYRKAAEVPDAPPFASRIYAELLRRLGRDRAAYEWLIAYHSTLESGDPMTMEVVVLERIRDLEDTLGIASDDRYDSPLIPDHD